MSEQIEGPSGADGPGAERRCEDRQKAALQAEAILLRAVGMPLFAVQTRDLSTHGIGFVSDRELFLGEYLAIALRIAKQKNGKLVLCHVCHCKTHSSRQYEIGAELVESIVMDGSGINVPGRWINLATGKE